MSIKGFDFNGVVHKYDYNALDNIPDLETDKTLTIDGAPADAKATGDRIANLQALVGSPLTASTAAGMTDQSKVYVYVGSETGYTNGNWYYYNGSAWVSGGVYNSVAVDIDTTLTLSNKAPDSKVVGDEIGELKENITNNSESTSTASKAYTSGDYLILDSVLYRVTDAIASGDTIAEGTNVEKTSVTEEISEVYTGRVTTSVGSINKLNPSDILENSYIGSAGEIVTLNGYSLSGFIPLDTTYTSIAFTGNNADGTARVCLPINTLYFFDANQTMTSRHGNIPSRTITAIPSEAAYVRICVDSSFITSRYGMVEFVDALGDISATYVPYETVVSRTKGLTELISDVEAMSGIPSDVEDLSDEVSAMGTQVEAAVSAVDTILGATQTLDKLATFSNGGINSNNGTYNSYYRWRIATQDIVTLSSKITIVIESGFRLYAARFNNGTFQSAGWVTDGTTFDAGSELRLMVARTTDNESETADIPTFCSKVTYTPDGGLSSLTAQAEENTEAIKNLNAISTYGLTWDWWITCNSVDTFGNAYIGYVDTDGYAGVLRRQPDGTMQYKRLEKLADDDDHNACATIVLDDGRILVIGSYGHTVNNHIVCWRSKTAYSIDEMESLSFNIPQTGSYTYKTCYSQIFKYNGKLFNFLRFGSIPSGESNGTYGYACLISTDNGSTWTAYKVFNNTDAYNGMAQCTDSPRYIKVVVAANPAAGAFTFRGCYIDLSTYKIYDLSDTEIGSMIALDGGSIVDSGVANYDDMTALIAQTQNNLKGRLFYVAPTAKASTVFLYATALDTASSDFKYKRYDGTVLELGNSGVGFGNVHYISGACFGKDADTIYYAKATTTKADGAHELHRVKIASGSVEKDEIITEASMCIIRPLFLGNGELATVVGHYNDQNANGTYNGSFTSWELKPLFTCA